MNLKRASLLSLLSGTLVASVFVSDAYAQEDGTDTENSETQVEETDGELETQTDGVVEVQAEADAPQPNGPSEEEIRFDLSIPVGEYDTEFHVDVVNGDFIPQARLDATIAFQEQQLDELNKLRAEQGVPGLTLNPELSKIAYLKSADMAENNYFEHDKPGYGTISEQVQYFTGEPNPYPGLAENIAYSPNPNGLDVFELGELALEPIKWWKDESPRHYEQMINPDNTEVGIGAYKHTVGDQSFVIFTHFFIQGEQAPEEQEGEGGVDEDPVTEEPGTEEPGTDEEPGTEEPGTEEPGTEEPGTEETTDEETTNEDVAAMFFSTNGDTPTIEEVTDISEGMTQVEVEELYGAHETAYLFPAVGEEESEVLAYVYGNVAVVYNAATIYGEEGEFVDANVVPEEVQVQDVHYFSGATYDELVEAYGEPTEENIEDPEAAYAVFLTEDDNGMRETRVDFVAADDAAEETEEDAETEEETDEEAEETSTDLTAGLVRVVNEDVQATEGDAESEEGSEESTETEEGTETEETETDEGTEDTSASDVPQFYIDTVAGFHNHLQAYYNNWGHNLFSFMPADSNLSYAIMANYNSGQFSDYSFSNLSVNSVSDNGDGSSTVNFTVTETYGGNSYNNNVSMVVDNSAAIVYGISYN